MTNPVRDFQILNRDQIGALDERGRLLMQPGVARIHDLAVQSGNPRAHLRRSNALCWLYNAALEERIDCYRKTGKTRTYIDQCKALTQCRRELPNMGELPVNLQRWTLKRLDDASFAGSNCAAATDAGKRSVSLSLAAFGSTVRECASPGCSSKAANDSGTSGSRLILAHWESSI